MTTVCVATAEGPVYLKFVSIEQAMKQIGAANLATLRRWNESLETQTFESSALAHVEGMEAQKPKRMMRDTLGVHTENAFCIEYKCTPEPETTSELVSRITQEGA